MAEGLKAVSSVIRAHTAVPHSAEGQAVVPDLQQDIVHAAAAEGEPRYERLRFPLIPRKDIAGERLFPRFDFPDCRIKFIVGDNRQQGPEDFFPHTGVVKLRLGKEGRCNLFRALVPCPAYYLFFCGNQAEQALIVSAVDDFRVTLPLLCLRIAPLDFR